MAIIKCKMCGGDIELAADKTLGTCNFCGTTMTFPKIDDDQRAAAFNRGNHFRRIGEFDKALAVYERIVREDDTDAEAHWCCALCRFGIEYVEDPATYEYLPTCHRASFDSFLEDVDYLAAVKYSEGVTKRQYQKDGAKIAEVQRGILATSQNEDPFDVFICYKESDENGDRTKDSLMAQDIYYQLTEQGYRVFFSRITLEDMAGKQYEPYIFAALNSAKVMIVLGTKPEYMNAVWVKNEWSRFLTMMKKDRHKLLLPCYRDMDPYDMPEQLSVLQSYDMAKIGFIQDLIRGIKKVLDADKKPEPAKETVVVQQAAATSTAPLLQRAFMFLEDGKWDSADEYCEKVLDLEPKNAMAYVGKLMANLRVKKQESLKDYANPFDGNEYYQKALRFGDDGLKESLTGYITHIKTRNENARIEGIYSKAKKDMSAAKREGEFKQIAAHLESIPDYKDSAQLAKECYEKAEIARKDWLLIHAKDLMAANTIPKYQEAIKDLKQIPGWKDADEQFSKCRQAIHDLQVRAEQERIARAERAEKDRLERERIAKEKKKKTILISAIAAMVAVILIFTLVLTKVIIPNGKYNDAVALMDAGNYTEAIAAFESLNGYKDSDNKIEECHIAILDAQYNRAMDLLKARNYTEAIAAFKELDNYKDSADQILDCRYLFAVELMNTGSYSDAIAEFKELEGYKDSYEKIEECKIAPQYNEALSLKDSGETAKAAMLFGSLGDFQDAKQQSMTLWEQIAIRETISTSNTHTIGLKPDGTVVAVGNNGARQCEVDDWMNIVAISTESYYTVGLKADGTVVNKGNDSFGQVKVSGWTDIVAISAGGYHTVGLKTDGTVVAVGDNNSGECNVSDWRDIVAISAGAKHTVGLKADGTVVAVGDNKYNECNVSGWTDIVAISAGDSHTVGLKADGTVVVTGSNTFGQSDVSDWTDIVAVSAGWGHTVGLKADGTVIATKHTGAYNYGQSDVSDWTDIVVISAGDTHTVGLKADGTVVAVGNNLHGQCDVSDWTNIAIPDKKNP